MTKADIISTMADKAGISQAAASRALAGCLDAISDALANGEKVTLVGFGTFSVSKRAARKGRNPQTGDIISIPAANVPKFKPGASLRQCCKG